jgi:hypothetical protein
LRGRGGRGEKVEPSEKEKVHGSVLSSSLSVISGPLRLRHLAKIHTPSPSGSHPTLHSTESSDWYRNATLAVGRRYCKNQRPPLKASNGVLLVDKEKWCPFTANIN